MLKQINVLSYIEFSLFYMQEFQHTGRIDPVLKFLLGRNALSDVHTILEA